MNPDPFTYRELQWLHQGKARLQWDHTAQVLAKLHNAWFLRDGDSAAQPADFHPFYCNKQVKKIDAWTDDLSFLKKFCSNVPQE